MSDVLIVTVLGFVQAVSVAYLRLSLKPKCGSDACQKIIKAVQAHKVIIRPGEDS